MPPESRGVVWFSSAGFVKCAVVTRTLQHVSRLKRAGFVAPGDNILPAGWKGTVELGQGTGGGLREPLTDHDVGGRGVCSRTLLAYWPSHGLKLKSFLRTIPNTGTSSCE